MIRALIRYFKNLLNSVFPGKIQDPTFLEVLNEYSANHAKENLLTEDTKRKYTQLINNITLFLKCRGKADATLMEVRLKTMEELKAWLHNNLSKCSIDHASRHIELCKRVSSYAVKMEIIAYSPIAEAKTTRDRTKEVIACDLKELIRMQFYVFANDIFGLTADYYIFQATTGLSYGDVVDYEITEIKNTNTGKMEQWVYGRRHKTERQYWVPLFYPAELLHLKYNGQFPYLANGTYNKMIKEIALILNIKKHLTTHTARKTFATIRNNNGWSRESIMDMMGLKSMKVLEEHYLQRDYKRVQKEWNERLANVA